VLVFPYIINFFVFVVQTEFVFFFFKIRTEYLRTIYNLLSKFHSSKW